MSAFVLEDGVVYHSYSAYARGLDSLWGAYQWYVATSVPVIAAPLAAPSGGAREGISATGVSRW